LSSAARGGGGKEEIGEVRAEVDARKDYWAHEDR